MAYKIEALASIETQLVCESVDAADVGGHCAECGDTGPKEQLFIYYTVRGLGLSPRTRRRHDGVFCSKPCHDRWHGLNRR